MKLLKTTAFCTTLLILLNACSDSDLDQNRPDKHLAKLKVTMHDTEGPYDAVYIDILDVKAHIVQDDSGSWISLDVNPGIYDLLLLQNGVDTVIVNEGILPPGKLSQLRLILGSANTVVVDSQSYALKTPGSHSSGLKINVHEKIAPGGVYDLVLDFDANSSVVFKSDSGYILKPVIKVESVIQLN